MLLTCICLLILVTLIFGFGGSSNSSGSRNELVLVVTVSKRGFRYIQILKFYTILLSIKFPLKTWSSSGMPELPFSLDLVLNFPEQ